jgi:hypothetical protein
MVRFARRRESVMNKDELKVKLEDLKGRVKDAAEGLAGKHRAPERDRARSADAAKDDDRIAENFDADQAEHGATRVVEEADDE